MDYFFRWNIALPNLLYLFLLPYILCRFFCSFCGVSSEGVRTNGTAFHRRRQGAGYAFLSAGLTVFEVWAGLPGSAGLVLETALLAVYGTFVLKRPWRESWMTALLLRSVFGAVDSIFRWMDYRLFLPLVLRWEAFILPADAVRELLKVLSVIGFLTLILRYFYKNAAGLLREQLLLLIVPLFFIALVERMVQDTFYVNAFMVDTDTGAVSAEIRVSHGENLLLQLLAGVCLPVLLLLHQKLVRMQLAEKKLLYLSGQAAQQKRYMEEAAVREKQTQAFRHDLQNHLTVLQELLQAGQTEKACAYLGQLDEAARGLSSEIRTGNPAVDVLLGNKCRVAEEKGICVRCELSVPKESVLKDIDWCILLSNALDNAVSACGAAAPEKRYLHLSGRKKGNLYLLLLENSCDRGLETPPPEGIGLSNIRAVLEPLGGTMDKTVSDGVYKLKLLFRVS